MNLSNPFSEEVRLLYLYRYDCDLCGCNQSLEIHHIVGRTSNSAFNSSLLCHDCHSQMCHSEEEERRLFAKTFAWLKQNCYNIKSEDIEFFRNNFKRLDVERIWQILN
jgi:hypothetical protein